MSAVSQQRLVDALVDVADDLFAATGAVELEAVWEVGIAAAPGADAVSNGEYRALCEEALDTWKDRRH